MKPVVIAMALLCGACSPRTVTPIPGNPVTTRTAADPTAHTSDVPATTSDLPPGSPAYRTPALHSAWQIQYTGDLDYSPAVDVFNLDLFEADPADIHGLRERGVFVMCYFSAGSFEDWRPDTADFPPQTLGLGLDGWPGERWLDIRRLPDLLPVMETRLDLATRKGCDGVDPDNLDGFANQSGFPLTYDDQLAYNIALAEAAHSRGLSIGLKNDLGQIIDLLPWFDWALNEQCFQYQECDLLLPFIQAGKPVFHIEYDLRAEDFCPEALKLGFNSIRKNLQLDGFVTSCSG